MNLTSRSIIFAPHPDDEIFGCFGAIMSHLKREEDLSVVYLTSGERGDSSISPLLLKRTREGEARKVMSSLGIRRYRFLGLRDGGLEYDQNTVSAVADVIAKDDPVCAYAPNAKEPHRDHRNACKVISEALQFLASDKKHFEIRYYEVWMSLDKFNLVIDISSLAETKRKVIRIYESQLKRIRYDEEILSLNRYRGTTTKKGSCCEVYDCYKIYPKKTQRMRKQQIKSEYQLGSM